ncbi:MAG: dienelactone hydrolase family protein [Candidatus Eremiobacteraeota bacterium]|nr:dienelactone hydrolase family protein [Candidatus Eremiobacteraeota bacterium]
MRTETVTIPVGDLRMPAYVARPDADRAPCVIVLQEIFGVNEDIRAVTELVGSAGYLAVAPAIFHRTDPAFEAGHDEAGYAKGRAARDETKPETLTADVEATVTWLRAQQQFEGGIATWGFCFGGSVAFLSATLPSIDAAVSFYGGQIAGGPRYIDAFAEKLQSPILFAFGGKDAFIPIEATREIEQRLTALGKSFELHVYDDEDHGFFRHGPVGNEGSADVWPRVRAFLERHLRAAHSRV